MTAATVAANGLPQPALRAYRHAESVLADGEPGCHLPWTLLAGIGKIESDHGRYGGAVVGADGVSDPLIRGVALDGGPGIAAIPDSDGGRYDGDRVWDRAVGPMQFIPTTWATVGVDGDGDGEMSPNDIDDAALASGVYLCAGGGDLADPTQLRAAVFRYNHSSQYVDTVTAYAAAYAQGDFSSIVVPAGATTPAKSAGADREDRTARGHDAGAGNAQGGSSDNRPDDDSGNGQGQGGGSGHGHDGGSGHGQGQGGDSAGGDNSGGSGGNGSGDAGESAGGSGGGGSGGGGSDGGGHESENGGGAGGGGAGGAGSGGGGSGGNPGTPDEPVPTEDPDDSVDPDDPCDLVQGEPPKSTDDPDEACPTEEPPSSDDSVGSGGLSDLDEQNPTNGRSKVTRAVELDGPLTSCSAEGGVIAPTGAWCVEGAYAGDLVTFAEGADLTDLDGDCAKEETATELAGLAKARVQTAVEADQVLVAGEVVDTTVTSFQPVAAPVCERPATGADGAHGH